MFSVRRLRYLVRRILRGLGRATGTAHQIALGVAIGFFVGWLPIVGIQMAVAVVLCALLKANQVVPIFPIWLTNPVTLVPIFSFNYWVGWLLVGGPPLSDLAEVLKRMLAVPVPTEEMGRLAAWWAGIRLGIGELLSMGWDMQLPLWLGCILVGLSLAIPAYYLSYRFVESFREAVARKKRLRQDRRRRAAGVDAQLGGSYTSGDWSGEL
ncbi:MAG: DUF2062 domain-containing protein [Planctomycetes bacterium]|nr:DUF2062 domain-containing protein [Planctomycetota bacterium]